MPGPVYISRRESSSHDSNLSPLLHPALSTSLSRSFGLSSPFSLNALSSSLTALSSSPRMPAGSMQLSGTSGAPMSFGAMSFGVSHMQSALGSSLGMSLGRSFEEQPKLEQQFFRNFSCCGLDLQDLHRLLEHFEECHASGFDDDGGADPAAKAAVAAAVNNHPGGLSGAARAAAKQMGTSAGRGGSFAARRRLAAGGPPGLMDDDDMILEEDGLDANSDGTVSAPPSPRLLGGRVPSSSATLAGVGPNSVGMGMNPSKDAFDFNSPATMGMELEMDMDDMQEPTQPPSLAATPSSMAASASIRARTPSHRVQQGASPFLPPPISAFDSPMHAKKPFSSAPASRGASPSSAITGQATSPSGSIVSAGGPTASTSGAGVNATDPAALNFAREGFFGAGVGVPPSAVSGNLPTSTASLAPNLLFPPVHGAAAQAGGVAGSEGLGLSGSSDNMDEEDEHDDEDDDDDVDDDGFDGASIGSSSMDGRLPRQQSRHRSTSSDVKSEDDPRRARKGSHTQGKENNKDGKKSAKNNNGLVVTLSPSVVNSLTAANPLGTGVQISPSGRPYTPPSEKPFKCSVPGCDKSYKQQNGLKYHRLHGHCNTNNFGKDGEDARAEGKPYVCHVASCGKRYKNMNGLRYHYQHSGAHGALGLQMLASSCHPPPQYPPGHKRAQGNASASTSRANSPAPSIGSVRGSPQAQQPSAFGKFNNAAAA